MALTLTQSSFDIRVTNDTIHVQGSSYSTTDYADAAVDLCFARLKTFFVLFGEVSGNSNFYDKKIVNASTRAGLGRATARTGALITLLPFNAKCLNFSVLEHRFGAYYSQATRFFMAHSF